MIWSLFVLIDRTIDELHQAELEWQFWTKIVVEAIGCLGAGILFYVWGKIYFCLVRKWVTFNRTFVVIDSAPVPIKKKPPSVTNLHLVATAAAVCNGSSIPDSETALLGSEDMGGEKGNLEATALLLPPSPHTSSEIGPTQVVTT